MKVARFSVDGSDPRFGIVDEDELVVLSGDPMFQGFDTTGERVPLAGAKGPARTFSPINLWDVRLKAGAEVTLDLPEGHTAMIAVLSGHVTVDDTGAGEAEILRFAREGSQARLRADGDALLLVMTGQPLNEPVVGHGPFVMTSAAEIHQAIADFDGGRFGGA